MKRILQTLALIMIAAAPLAAAKPLLGIAGLLQNSPRTLGFANQVEEQLAKIVPMTGVFDQLAGTQFKTELQKFGCIEEGCIIRVARDLGLSVIVNGDCDDRGEVIVLRLAAYGIDPPFQGMMIASYRVSIPVRGRIGSREFPFVAEEHAGRFITRVLDRYRTMQTLSIDGDRATIERRVSGEYPLHRFTDGDAQPPRAYASPGRVRLADGVVTSATAPIQKGDFVLLDHADKVRYFKEFIDDRKREMIFGKPTAGGPASMFFLTGPASAVMPLLAPILGYYWNSDWQGLMLWTPSVAPYLYLEINGLSTYFKNYYRKKRDIPREARAQFYFGMYFLCGGGFPLFVDAFSYASIENARSFKSASGLMGNPYTAGYLALVGGGAAHFYRGKRWWGYLYFHLDNALLYLTLREFLPPQRYLGYGLKFQTGTINKTRAYAFLGAACAVRAAEFIHSFFITDDIRNGDLLEDDIAVAPVLMDGGGTLPALGLSVSYRY